MPDTAPLPSPVSPALRRSRRAVLAAVAGNALEFYDFVVYAFLAVYIGRAFFPPSAPLAGVLAALAVFGAGFVARPVGAWVLGRYADRAGRRPALLLSMLLITLATVAMALLPTYEQSGALAPLLLVICRLVQGFAYGGEAGPTTAWLLEIAPPGRRMLYSACFFAGQGAAVALAGLVGSLLATLLSAQDMQAWGWRVPFLLAALLAPLMLMLRRHMQESPLAGPAAVAEVSARRGPVTLWLTVALLGGTVANYVCTYLPTYAVTALGLPARVALATPLVMGLSTLLFGLMGGWLADLFGHRRVLLLSRLGTTLAALPVFAGLIWWPSAAMLWGGALVLSALNALNGGVLIGTIAQAFPRHGRAVATALIYAMGVAVFGGSTQFIAAGLIAWTGSPMAPAWYLLLTGGLALFALLQLRLPERVGAAGEPAGALVARVS